MTIDCRLFAVALAAVCGFGVLRYTLPADRHLGNALFYLCLGGLNVIGTFFMRFP